MRNKILWIAVLGALMLLPVGGCYDNAMDSQQARQGESGQPTGPAGSPESAGPGSLSTPQSSSSPGYNGQPGS